ncbi:MAG: 3-deoxy-manno-octulosonate cytidylyltransferase [Gammaproteobacteria bacterium]|nr:3-deoxy-manno-octulosonate cytidylyltransferase [Gammaproteobacteria bacterium]MDP2141357.1 3-deoxy-manno-octulosonate cytidylyltransferase [Gammaproteobacteria bacterium]MDP2349056.1 3-deoxy-manno-octulosonate cytidylyltransferase [Gammaproteobacteria bacterium]
MSFVVVIPARYASTRLPGKPLLDIAGKPMLQHVYERALLSDARAVYIATDDKRIRDAAIHFTDNVCMTLPTHQSGTDRIQEVAAQLALEENEIVVNVQGDEPLIPPVAINQVAINLHENPAAGIASLYEDIENEEEFRNPNAVKVVTDLQGFALYFSRSPVPWRAVDTVTGTTTVSGVFGKRHIGIYAYRVATLNQYVTWSQVELEISERLEQLRAMSHGVRIHMGRASEKMPGGVDTPEDLEAVRHYLLASKRP